MTKTVHVVHGEKPNRPKKNNEFTMFMYHTARMKAIIAQDPKIADQKLSKLLGISFNQLQDMKQFCKLNGMRVNE